MDKLSKLELESLFDEPVYVLNDSTSSSENQPATDKDVQVNIHDRGIVLKGGFEKHILVLINAPTADLLSNEDEAFVYKGLNALGYTEADIAIINTSQSGDQWKSLNDVKIVLALGTAIENIPSYQVTEKVGVLYLLSDSVDKIRASQELKVKFWNGLKALLTTH